MKKCKIHIIKFRFSNKGKKCLRTSDSGCVFILFFLCSPNMSKKRQAKEEIEFEETPQEKKLRLAKLYLEQLKEEGRLVYIIVY